MNVRFEDRVVLVTGSSRGLGAEIALGFAREGANVVINYNKSEKQAFELSNQINDTWQECIAIKANVGDHADVENMFNEIINTFGKIDILVNNAAIYEDSTVWNMEIDTWKKVIDSDLTSVFNCTKFALRSMRAQEYGRVINISSVVGQVGSFGTCNYSAAKAGIFGFTKAVAKEVAKKNITINTLALGFIEIGMLLRLPEEIQAMILQQIPMGRWGKPEEVAETVKFLASDDAAYITGQVIHLNGGYFM